MALTKVPGNLLNANLADLANVSSTSPSTNQVLKWNGSAWAPASDSAGTGGIGSLVADTSPQLGGTLDANSNNIDMGTNVITDTKVGYWDTAYSWGNHASSGYAALSSPTFTGAPLAPTASASTNTTQIATTAFVGTAVSNLVDSSPSALNTLNELAAALGDDASFSTTVTNSIATKLPLAGGTMSGALNMGSNNITTTGQILYSNVYSATNNLPSASTYHGMFAHVHATGKGYFAHGGNWIELANQSDLTTTSATATAALPKAGGTMTGALTLGGNLNVGSHDIVTSSNGNIDLDPNGSGKVVFKGNSTRGAGQFVLNCENNSHGITIKGPPHSAGASYTLTLPNNDGNANQLLKTDGSGVLSWADDGTGGSSIFAVSTMTGDGSDTTLTLSANPASKNNTQVYINGVYQPKSTYSVSGKTLTFSTAPSNGTSVEVTSSSNVGFSSNTMTGDGSDTTLTLSAAPGTENNTVVYIDGVYQPKSTYSVSGTTLTFSTAPPNGTSVEAMSTTVAGAFSVASMTGDGSDTTLTLSADPGTKNNTLVFIGGVYQPKSLYNISGATLTFNTAPPNGASVEAVVGDNADITLTAKSLGTDGQVLTSTGSGVAWENAGGAYNDFAIKTGNYTAVSKDQLIVNSSSAVTITLPASPSAGNVVFIKNAGTGTVTVARNGSNINSTADNGELTADAGATLVYVDSTIGWKEL